MTRYWLMVVTAMILPGVFAGIFEYMMTEGSSGWIPLVAALTGGLAAMLILWLIEQRKPEKPQGPNKTAGASEPDELKVEERIFTQRTPDELVASIRGLTEVAAGHVSERYLGQWLKVEGYVKDVYMLSSNKVIVVYISDAEPGVFLHFDAKRWEKHVAALDVEDKISAIGKIQTIGRQGIVALEQCEIEGPES